MIQDQSLIVLGLRQDARPSIEESGSRVDGLIDRLQAKSLARIRSGTRQNLLLILILALSRLSITPSIASLTLWTLSSSFRPLNTAIPAVMTKQNTIVNLNFLRICGASSKKRRVLRLFAYRAPRYIDAERMARDGLADMDREAAEEDGQEGGNHVRFLKKAPIRLRPSVR